ncbi:MAG: hypothetical protein HY876_07675 [Coriobacteriales bacterium]|nr:hypothetical protein [Coriobacteriales bacterium]
MTSSWFLVVLYAIYGLTFLVMAGAIGYYTRKAPPFGISRKMISLIIFAILHGFSDLLDAVLRSPGMDASPTSALAAARLVLLATSFVWLFLFGIVSLIDNEELYRVIVIVSVVAGVGVAAYLAAQYAEGATVGSMARVELQTRLFIALPACLLAAGGFYRVSRQCASLGMDQCRRGAMVAAGGMAAYGVLGGAFATGYPFVLRLFGVPIQVFRMGAAVVLTVGVIWMLQSMQVNSPREGSATH